MVRLSVDQMSRYVSPVNPAAFPTLSIVLLGIGIFLMAWFFVYEVTSTKYTRDWKKELLIALYVLLSISITSLVVFLLLFRSAFSVASIFLGYGGLFLLLWVGIFVWMATEEWWIFRAMFVFFVDLDVIRVDFLSVIILVFGACWGSFLSVKKSQDELLSSFLDSITNSSFSMFLIPQFVHIQSTGKIRLSHRGEISALLERKPLSMGQQLIAPQHRDTFVSMLTECMSIERARETSDKTRITHCKRDWHGKERRMGRTRWRREKENAYLLLFLSRSSECRKNERTALAS